MTPERMFQDLLGLGLNWEVIESRFDHKTSTVVLEIRETSRLWDAERCPCEGALVYCYDHTEEVVWRHLNVFQHRCEIHCRLPRKKCRKCEKIHRVRPPWEGLSGHFSKEFESFALVLIREMPMAKVAQVMGESDTRLWRLLFKHVDGAYGLADFSNVCCVGVDEMNIRKGHDYVSVFADLVAKRVLFATEGRDHKTWDKFVEALEKHNGHRHAITQASMDMSNAYQRGVADNCRNAQVVFDKFHLIANVTKAVDKVRQAEVRSSKKEVWDHLKNSLWIWRKNPENLTEKEQAHLSRMDQENLCTAKAYQMRLCLQDIYRLGNQNQARRSLLAWCRWVRWIAKKHKEFLFAPMLKAAQMVETHLAGILAHWKSGVTNAFMEGLNSVFSATKRKARGYRSSVYLITMLYLVAGTLRLPHS